MKGGCGILLGHVCVQKIKTKIKLIQKYNLLGTSTGGGSGCWWDLWACWAATVSSSNKSSLTLRVSANRNYIKPLVNK